MPFDMRYLAEEPADERPIDWGSILFFGGTVLGMLNWATLSILREHTATQYFYDLPKNPIDKAQVVTMLGGIGTMMGVMVMLTMGIFCAGPPSTEMMYSAAFMHLMGLIEQVVGLLNGNMEKLHMPKKPIIFWAVVNFFWSGASFWAAASDTYPLDYVDGETVFGWPWATLFYITCCIIVGMHAIKTFTLSFDEPGGEAASEQPDEKEPLK